MNETGKHKYSDIVICTRSGDPLIVLELLESSAIPSIQEHIAKTPMYMDLLGAGEGWVVLFTLIHQHISQPLWQSQQMLEQDVNTIYFWHDLTFSTVRFSAYWKDFNSIARQVIDMELPLEV